MNTARLHEILRETTIELRKGEAITGTPELVKQIKSGETELKGGGVVEFFAMPHVSEARHDLERVDLCFIEIGVDKAAAERHRDELISMLKAWPNPDRLADGPSYIEVGAEIGDQGAAFQLFALGQVLGLWRVITPELLGLTGEAARQAAGSGYIMITGFRQPITGHSESGD